MSKEHPQLSCKDVKTLLTILGFLSKAKKSGTSHEDFVGTFRGKYRKVTVDCHDAAFHHFLISSMASQAGLTKKEFYAAHAGVIPGDWKDSCATPKAR